MRCKSVVGFYASKHRPGVPGAFSGAFLLLSILGTSVYTSKLKVNYYGLAAVPIRQGHVVYIILVYALHSIYMCNLDFGFENFHEDARE